MEPNTRVSIEDLKNTWTLNEYNEWRDDYACRILLNWVKAGVVACHQLDIKQYLVELELSELAALMMESHDLVEKQGLPLVYRLLG